MERRRCQPKSFNRACTHYGRCGDADDQLGNGNDDRIAVLGGPDELQALKRLRVLGRRSSALEHPGRPIAARARDSNWHAFTLNGGATTTTVLEG